MINFNEYIDTELQDLTPDCYDELPNDNNLVNFPNNQINLSNQEIGKYVDMLLQMSDKENSTGSSKCTFPNEGNKEYDKLANILLEKGIL